jgi:hypothetical protein
LRNGVIETRFGWVVLRKKLIAIKEMLIAMRTEGVVLRKKLIAI